MALSRKPVTSSALRSVGFDAEHNVLEVEFQTGRRYRFYAVPAAVYRGLLSARSKGRFFNEQVAPVYRGHRLD